MKYSKAIKLLTGKRFAIQFKRPLWAGVELFGHQYQYNYVTPGWRRVR